MLEPMIHITDLRTLSAQEEKALCEEIRQFLVQNVSETGGHLASNLGVVELTLALHKVYDTKTDRLLFDVGHQAYVHKMLTGRLDQFGSLRRYGGIAGFPKPGESEHDAFVAGHASDAVSVALGMARARSLQNQNYDVVAVLGDGALTGGLAYEGLNDAGASGEPLVVVLNDNGMSIKPNVGAIAKYLSLVRLKPGYFEIKKWYRRFTSLVPGGRAVYRITHRFKDYLRNKLIGVTIFESMGFRYLGPVDGHDVQKLTFLLKEAKEMREPVLLHAITKKGKGYAPAESMPSSFHGVGRFDPETGVRSKSSGQSFSQTFGETLCRLADTDHRVCAITAAMEQGTGLSAFASRYPDRFFDVGIAEGHAVCMAAGLAKQGMIPVFAVYSTFLQRSYDMLLHDIGLLGLHVVFAVDRAGLVGEDGETHHGVFDVAFLSQVPGMQVFCPASQAELRRMLKTAVQECTGPIAVRYPKGTDGVYRDEVWIDRTAEDASLTILTYGTTVNTVLEAVRSLQKDGYQIDLIKLDQICPLHVAPVANSVKKTGKLLVVEEIMSPGCVGELLTAKLSLQGIPVKTALLNLGEAYVPHGDLASLRKLTGIDQDAVYQKAKELLYEE